MIPWSLLRVALVGLLAGGPLALAASAPGDDWPTILGPSRDGRVHGWVAPEAWPATGLPIRWQRPVGAGFAGPVVSRGQVFLFHREDDEEVLEAFAVEHGDPLWRTAYPTSYRDDFGFDEGPRSVPTVAAGRVFTFGAQGVLQAVDAASGERLWRVDTAERFGVRKGFFGAAGSPLVVDDRVLLNVGGSDDAGIVAFDAATGEVLWTATDHGASYSSPVLGEVGGEPAALFLTREGVVVIDPIDGAVRATLRWRSRSNASVNAASPLVLDGRIFVSASYGTGAGLLELREARLEALWTSDTALSTHYATAVESNGTLYGFHGALHLGAPALRAVAAATGEVRWSLDRFGGGSTLLVGDDLLILRDNGQLLLAAADPAGFRARAGVQILQGEVRALPAVAGGILYARGERDLVAVDLLLEPAAE